MPLFLDASPSAFKSDAIKVVKQPAPPAPGALNQDAATPVLDVEPPKTQFIQAVVNNGPGGTIEGVKVQMWAMAFGTGATPYLNSMNGTTGIEIPSGFGDPVDSGVPRTFSRTWDKARGLSATDPEIVPLLGAGAELHCCIKANVFAEDVNDVVTEGVRLGPSPSINFSDPRQAQRNMTIKTHSTGLALMMLMFAGNTDPEREQKVLLQVREAPIRRLTRMELRELDALVPWIRPSRATFEGNVVKGLEVVFGDERLPIRLAERPLEDLQIEIGHACGPELELVLGPDDPQRMVMQASLPDEDFVLRSLNVAQTERGEIVGEAHVLLLTAPDELLEKPREHGDSGA